MSNETKCDCFPADYVRDDDFHVPCQHELAAQGADLNGPTPGSWADVARMMASMQWEDGEGDGVNWDNWKDEMKETDGKGYGG